MWYRPSQDRTRTFSDLSFNRSFTRLTTLASRTVPVLRHNVIRAYTVQRPFNSGLLV